MKQPVFSSPLLRSRVTGETTTRAERWLGYFVGPCFVYMMYSGIAGNYLMQFYTDVLGLTGIVLTLMPLAAKLLSGLLGLLIGRLIDKTRTPQGKARPWLLLSGPMLALCGVLLYGVPRASYAVQIAWVVISYNLFFSLAFSVYSLSHAMMVPLSTRSTRERDSLAMMTSMGTSMIPGILTTIAMPLLIRAIGVGEQARMSWLTVMGILSALAIPATLVEYYFTLERVSAETEASREPEEQVSFLRQVRACLRDRYWVMIILFTAAVHFCTGISHGVQLYYCNWVLENSIDAGAAKQILVNVVGQAPLGYGIALLWPMVRKFGKRIVCIVGFSIAAAGSLLVFFAGDSTPLVLAGLLIRSTGALPTYTMAALLAEALDHVEQTRGLRADGFSASVSSICQTVTLGLSQTILLAGIHALGYITPESTAQSIAQPEGILLFFRSCYGLVPMFAYLLCVLIMLRYKPGSPDGQALRKKR